MADRVLKPILLIEDQPITGRQGSDRLGLEPFAQVAAGVALGTTGPFTIGVYASWGQGKTSLLRRTQGLVREANLPHVVPVWFNAWQYEREEHPLFPLIAAIIDAAEDKAGKCGKGKQDRARCEKLTRLGASLRALTRGMKFTGKVGMPLVGEVGVEFDADKALQAEEILGNQTNPLQGEMLYQSAFDMLEKVTGRDGDTGEPLKVIVFIDDLDRCLPDKALALLESIKLVLNQPGFIFLLALDPEIVIPFLTKRYRAQYGVKPEAAEDTARTYLHKIVQLQFDIPHHPARKFTDYVSGLVAANLGTDSPLRDIVDELAVSTSRNPRELVRLLNNLIIDQKLWDAMAEDTPADEPRWPERDVLVCMTISRVLLHYLGAPTTHALAMSDDIYEVPPPEATPVEPDAPAPEPKGAPRPDDHSEVSAALQKVWHHKALSGLLRTFGAVWLTTPPLRRRVYEFYQERDTTWTAPETQQAIFDRAVRAALELEPNDPIPAERLKGITSLDLESERDFGDAGMRLLAGLAGLRFLSLHRTSVTDAGLAHLAGMTRLRSLNLAGTAVEGAGLEHLAGMQDLEQINLIDTNVTDDALPHLGRLGGLRALALNGTQVSDRGVEALAAMHNLRFLHLEDTQVSREGIHRLRREHTGFTLIAGPGADDPLDQQ